MGKGDQAKLGYYDHDAVDGGKARIIVGALVTPADVQDNQASMPVVDYDMTSPCFRQHDVS